MNNNNKKTGQRCINHASVATTTAAAKKHCPVKRAENNQLLIPNYSLPVIGVIYIYACAC
jgi:hypothetical protein